MKERHNILTQFKEGTYKIIVASHVLNEGVDVPDARIAIILSGTGSIREYVQRLGRVLRKGSQKDKLAILYEVVSEDTSEERTSKRRKGKDNWQKPKPKKNAIESQHKQLEFIDNPAPYDIPSPSIPKAAESSGKYES